MWEVGGSGEAHVSSIGDVDGYSHIVYIIRLSLHFAAVARQPFSSALKIFKTSDIEITWFRRWKS